MAIFRPGPLISQISGDLGGINFAQGKSRAVVRAKAMPPNQDHPLQRRNRILIAQAEASWRDDILSDAEVLQRWILLAQQVTSHDRLGQRREDQARRIYISEYISAAQINLDPAPLTFVRPPRTPVPETVTFTASAATGISYSLSGGFPLHDEQYVFFLMRSFKPSEPSQFPAGVLATPQVTGPTFGTELTSRWNSAFGPLVQNQWIAIAVKRRRIDGGEIRLFSTLRTDSTLVTA